MLEWEERKGEGGEGGGGSRSSSRAGSCLCSDSMTVCSPQGGGCSCRCGEEHVLAKTHASLP